MPQSPQQPGSRDDRGGRAVTMALVFGLLSVPWTFGFEQVAGLPLWPSFIASASYFAAGSGSPALARSLAGNLVGAAYGAATLWLVVVTGSGVLGLSIAVGAFMLLASLHALVPLLSSTPAGFLGFAVLFSVHAADLTLATSGLTGELVAAGASLAIGAGLGFLADRLTSMLSAPAPVLGQAP